MRTLSPATTVWLFRRRKLAMAFPRLDSRGRQKRDLRYLSVFDRKHGQSDGVWAHRSDLNFVVHGGGLRFSEYPPDGQRQRGRRDRGLFKKASATPFHIHLIHRRKLFSANRGLRASRCAPRGNPDRLRGGIAARVRHKASASRVREWLEVSTGCESSQSLIIGFELNQTSGDIESDLIAHWTRAMCHPTPLQGRHAERPSRKPSAHSCVREPNHVGYALTQQLWGQGHISHLSHAWISPRPTVLKNKNAGFIYIERLVVDAGVKLFNDLDTTARPRCCNSCGLAADGLMTAPSGKVSP